MSLPYSHESQEGSNNDIHAAVNQMQQERNRFSNQHVSILSPQQQQQHLLGHGGMRPGGGPNHTQSNLTTSQLMSMMQAPNPSVLPPGFNPYGRHQPPHQNGFQPFLPHHGYGGDIAFSQPQRHQATAHHAHFGNPYVAAIPRPEELHKQAAQAQAQVQAQGFFGYGGQRHIGHPHNIMNRGPAVQQYLQPCVFGQDSAMVAAAARLHSQMNMGMMQATSSNDEGQMTHDGDMVDDAHRNDSVEGDNMQTSSDSNQSRWPLPPPILPQDKQEYSLSDIINSLASGNRLSPESARAKGRGRGGRGRGRGRGKGRTIMSLTKTGPDGTIIPIHSAVLGGEKGEEPPVWYSGSVSLGLEEDQFWLSELQVYLRSNFAEAFGATEADIAAPMHGRNKPIALGQVGIRCIHCKDEPPSQRGQQAVSYPSLISGIYNSVQQMFRLHFDCCTKMPQEVRAKIEALRSSSSSRGGRKQYWVDSARRLGLVDTPHGIHFGRDPSGPLPPLDGPSAKRNMKNDEDAESGDDESHVEPLFHPSSLLSQEHSDEMKRQKEEAYPLVLPEDKPLISDYLYLTLEQMEPCKLMDADRVGCYKGRTMGFRGLACKWCVGQAGCGRYFPASEASLSQTTTSQTILNHVRNCRRCPAEIRENLEIMKSSKTGPGGKKLDKPKHGGRKVFFHRLWCRIQGVPIDEFENIEAKIGRQKGARNKKRSLKQSRKRKNSREHMSSDSDSDSTSDDDDDDQTETEEEDDADEPLLKKTKKNAKVLNQVNMEYEDSGDEHDSLFPTNDSNAVHHGCVPLSKNDDVYWLSELQCFVRSHMVEVFSAKKEDVQMEEEEDIVEGQVGVRCSYCAKISSDERPDGYAYFPQSLSTIYQNVSDLQRRHFLKCSEMPDDARKTFQSLRGFAAKAESETKKYWIDSAREVGITDFEEKGGIKFFRDPSTPSAADLIEKERGKIKKNAVVDRTSLVRPTDVSTDYSYLLMKQMRPCRFKNSDRRVGPGSRGRDRALGFPGIACKYCSSKDGAGRFFPVASKSLADNTANAISSHLASCNRCPESVKSSLAYLSHRASLQNAELEGGWKKTFFKQIWDRLHVERSWTNGKSKDNDTGGTENDESSAEEDDADASDVEEVDEMVKAAAQWLTKRDAQHENSVVSSNHNRQRTSRGRGLPSRKRRDSNDDAAN